jgi:general secretion pathway protein G
MSRLLRFIRPDREARFPCQAGLSLFELILVLFLISTLSALAQPLFKNSVRREKERELTRDLRIMREAIDLFHTDWERDVLTRTGPYCKRYAAKCLEISGESGYPKTLSSLLKVELITRDAEGAPKDESRRYLRQVPNDPMTGTTDWGLRCEEDPPDSTSWCGKDVYDVHTTSTGIALNQTSYATW